MPDPSTSPASTATEPADEPTWQRNRRLRQAELEAANERGQALISRYGEGGVSRPLFAAVKPTRWRLRR